MKLRMKNRHVQMRLRSGIKNVVAIALKKNMLSLNGDTFEPEKAINGNDAAQILKAIDRSLRTQ